jgi:thiol-disulfide isomerase/thioredoxin
MILRTRGLLVVLAVLWVTAMAQADKPELALPDLKGRVHKLSDYHGKWVVVNYWATWCPPCLDEIPELVAFHDKYSPDKATVLGVNFEEPDRSYLKQFAEQNFISYPILIGDLKSKTPFGLLYGLPTTYVISPQGELVYQHTGGVSMNDLEQVMHKGSATVQK